jgi:murein DD-endopeptidase MepM/ murein hydrolase activator NlpD
MFTASLLSVKKHAVSFRWSVMISIVLAVWMAACSLMMVQDRIRSGDSLARALSNHSFSELLQTSHTSWHSDANASGPAHASAANDAGTSGNYFRTLTRLYGASVLHRPQAFDEPLPRDEVSTFHELETPVIGDDVSAFHQMETHTPVTIARISSGFGERLNPVGKGHVFHRGIDLAAPVGTPVYAVAEGTVIKATHERTYGKIVVINHHNGYKTLYAHNSQLLVKTGERVKVGQQIAKVGSTGRSTGPHLHFEILRDGERVDPAPYLAAMLVIPQKEKVARG